MTAVASGVVAEPLSRLLRAGSRAEHTAAESSHFMERLLHGRIRREGYGAYLLRLIRVYDALEDAARSLAGDPFADAVVDRRIERRGALAADLEHWVGPGWRDVLVDSPATHEYVDRIGKAARDWGGLFVAHHYTRYLGDLSGGQAVGRVVARAYHPPRGVGTAFYTFPEISKPKRYKDAYRARLDSLRMSAVDKQRIVSEVKSAFRLNSAVFDELGALY